MLIIGHRGASGYAPENTLDAFELAFSQGADGIECDLFQVEQSTSIVIHDFHLDRTTNGTGYVPECHLSDIRTLNAGQGQTIPLLIELFNAMPKGKWCNLELKYIANLNSWINELSNLLTTFPEITSQLVISSFHHPWLNRISKALPDVKVAYLIAHYPLHLKKTIREFNAFAVNVDINILDQKLVDVIHANKQQVWVFTVNKVDDMKRCKKMGVDGIFTNFPDIARNLY